MSTVSHAEILPLALQASAVATNVDTAEATTGRIRDVPTAVAPLLLVFLLLPIPSPPLSPLPLPFSLRPSPFSTPNSPPFPASFSSPSDKGASFRDLQSSLRRSCSIPFQSLHNISLQVGPPESERSSPAAPLPLTTPFRPHATMGATSFAMTPTLSMLDTMVEQERCAAHSRDDSIKVSSGSGVTGANLVQPGRGMPMTPLTVVASSSLCGAQDATKRAAPQEQAAQGRSPLAAIQEGGGRPPRSGKTKSRVPPSLGPLPSIPASLNASAIQTTAGQGGGYDKPHAASLHLEQSPPAYQSLIRMRSSSSTGVVSATGDPRVYQHLASRTPEYASMANPVEPDTPLQDVSFCSKSSAVAAAPTTEREPAGQGSKPVFLGQIGKKKGTRSLLSVWQRALKPERNTTLA